MKIKMINFVKTGASIVLFVLLSSCKPVGQIFDDNLAPINPSISINSGASTTQSLTVTLNLDSVGAHEMYITNSAECTTGGSYESYVTSKSWTLEQDNGTAIVYVKFRDRAGNETDCINDFISYNDSEPLISNPSFTTPSNDETPSIGFNLKEDATVTLYSDSNCSLSISSPVELQAGARSITTNTLSPEGDFNIYAKGINALNNESCISLGTFVLDMTGPTSPTISINNGDAQTNSTIVDLTLSVVGADQMYITNTEGCSSNGNWENYSASKLAWVLGQSSGTATVYLKYQDQAGNESPCVSDTIEIAPRITNVTASSSNGVYTQGETVNVQVVFESSITVTGIPTLTLETGTSDAVVNYTGGSGSNTLVFQYTVGEGENSSDLSYLSISSLELPGGATITGAVNANLTLPVVGDFGSLSFNKNIVIDTDPIVQNVTSSKDDGTYGVGELIPIQVVFSESVVVSGTPNLEIETGTTDAILSYTSGSGTDTLVFNYTVASGENSLDLDYVGTTSLTLNSGTIRDTRDNNALLTLSAPGASESLGFNKAIVINTPPMITNVTSNTSDGTYGVGAVIGVQVIFSKAVTVTGSPLLTLETGTIDRTAICAAGSGTTVSCTYTVQLGDTSSDLDYVATTSLALNDGTIKDFEDSNVNAELTLPVPSSGTPGAGSLADNQAIAIKTPPMITNVTSATANSSYDAGESIIIDLVFNESVTVTGSPLLTLETGTIDRTAICAAGSGTTVSCTYTVQLGDTSSDLDYVATTSLALNDGTIRDSADSNVNAELILPVPSSGTPGAGSLADNKAIVINPTPVVTSVTSNTADGTYGVGEVIGVQVIFSEAVTVTGSPILTLTTGSGSTTAVAYTSGSEDTTLLFNYIVAQGDSFSDLDYSATTSLDLNGGTIESSSSPGQTAIIALASPGATNSLGANANLRSLLYAMKAGTVDNAEFGTSLTSGDINGDTYPDVIVGMPSYNSGDGRVIVYSGNPNATFGTTILMDISGAVGLTESFGNSVTVANIDGDGDLEVIVGIPLFNDTRAPGTVDQGKVSAYSYDSGDLDPAPVYSIIGSGDGDQLGTAVANLEDMNTDGKDDFIVGIPFANVGGSDRGQVKIYSGIDGSPMTTLSGNENNALFGSSVARIGDITADGIPDFIVSAPLAAENGTQRGQVRVYNGDSFNVLYNYYGSSDNDLLGTVLAGNADVDEDNVLDFMIGSPFIDPLTGGTDRGEVIVYSGATGLALYTKTGGANSDYFGSSIDFVGDLNNDGNKDFIIGAPQVSVSGTIKGQVLIYSGVDGGILYTINGSETDANFGGTVLGLRDNIEDDSRSNFVVAAPLANEGGINQGKIFVYR